MHNHEIAVVKMKGKEERDDNSYKLKNWSQIHKEQLQ